MKEIKRFITITLACCAISTTQAQLAEPYYKLEHKKTGNR